MRNDGAFFGKLIKRRVQRSQEFRAVGVRKVNFFHVNSLPATTAPLTVLSPCILDQDSPHRVGGGDFNTYIGGNPLHNFFADDNEWFTPLDITSSTIIYDLGAAYRLDHLALWNEEFSGIQTMMVATSNDPTFGTSTPVGTFNPINTPFDQDYGPQAFTLTETTTARYVQLMVEGPQIPNRGNYVSMGEIAFGVPVK